MKPQPQHNPDDLARIVRVAPGAQSPAGRRLVKSGLSPRSWITPEPRRPLVADLTQPRKGQARWGA